MSCVFWMTAPSDGSRIVTQPAVSPRSTTERPSSEIAAMYLVSSRTPISQRTWRADAPNASLSTRSPWCEQCWRACCGDREPGSGLRLGSRICAAFFKGLSSVVETVLEQAPYSGHVFVFRSKRADDSVFAHTKGWGGRSESASAGRRSSSFSSLILIVCYDIRSFACTI